MKALKPIAALGTFEVLLAPAAAPAQPADLHGLSDEGRRLLLDPDRVTIDDDSPLGLVHQIIEANLAAPDAKCSIAMRRLLESGTPDDRFYACVLQVSWGDGAAFDTLQSWAREPSTAPAVHGKFYELATAVGRGPLLGEPTRRRRRAASLLLGRWVSTRSIPASGACCTTPVTSKS